MLTIVDDAPTTLDSFLSANSITPDTEYWLADGNVVFITEGVCFCVHRSVLSLASDFFRDLLSLPQPALRMTSFNGPVIDLQDSAGDFRLLLRVLYNKRMNLGRGKQITVTEVEAIARMAHKYQLEELRDDAVAFLKTIFTDDWDTWDRLSQTKELSTPALHFTPVEAILVVDMATRMDLNFMLLAALYLCCQLKGHELLEGAPAADGTTRVLAPRYLALCIDSKPRLAQTFANARTHMLTGTMQGHRACREACAAELARARETLLQPLVSVDPAIDSFCAEHGVCHKCRGELKQRRLEFRRLFWDKLPQFFKIGSWEELRTPGPP